MPREDIFLQREDLYSIHYRKPNMLSEIFLILEFFQIFKLFRENIIRHTQIWYRLLRTHIWKKIYSNWPVNSSLGKFAKPKERLQKYKIGQLAGRIKSENDSPRTQAATRIPAASRRNKLCENSASVAQQQQQHYKPPFACKHGKSAMWPRAHITFCIIVYGIALARPDKYICESGDIICERASWYICIYMRARAGPKRTTGEICLHAAPEQNYPIVRARWMML